jgi:tetratricopeptide (TPR) repeat protein
MGQYDQALSQFERARDLWVGSGDRRSAALESSGAGAILANQGRFGAAAKSAEEAVTTFRDLKESGVAMAELLGAYGAALGSAGQLDAARKALEEGADLARGLQNPGLNAQMLVFQLERFMYAGDYAAARALAEQTLDAATRSKDARLILLAKLDEARLAVKEGRGTVAVATLAALTQQADSLGFRHLGALGAVSRAEGLIALRQYPRARQELEAAVSRSERLGLRGLLAESHYLLGTALRLSGEGAEARRHYAEAVRLLDEIRQDAPDILRRADLGTGYNESAQWAKADASK